VWLASYALDFCRYLPASSTLSLTFGSPALGATLTSITITVAGTGQFFTGAQAVVNPSDNKVYVGMGVVSGATTTATLLASNVVYSSLGASSTFSAISITGTCTDRVFGGVIVGN
jgi:hypothetical protein